VVILMKKLVLSFVLFLFAAITPLSVHAEVDDGEFVSAEVVWPLLNWVSREMGVPAVSVPSVIASRSQFRQVLSSLGRSTNGRAQAVFVSGRVILDSRLWDAQDATQRSILVHELVHYVQSRMRSGSWGCSAQKEVEAYTLQNKWLEEQGHSAFVSASWIRRVSACRSATTVASLDE
jgi:hypothetical protein